MALTAGSLNSPFSPNNTPGLGAEQLDIQDSNNLNPLGASTAYYQAYTERVVIAPEGVGQIGAFAFDYEGSSDVSMGNDITDHWLEDNTTVQDQIGVKSNIIVLRGYVAELALQASISATINALLSTVECTLTQADAYLGKYTPGVEDSILTAITQVQNIAYQTEQALARVAQVASFFLPGPSMNKQQAAFAQLSALRNARILFTVFTPFQVFYNCAIIDLRAIQSEKTNTISDFSVTMKQLQFASNLSPSFYAGSFGGNSQYSNQALTSNGVTSGTPSPFSNLVSSFSSAGSTAGHLFGS